MRLCVKKSPSTHSPMTTKTPLNITHTLFGYILHIKLTFTFSFSFTGPETPP